MSYEIETIRQQCKSFDHGIAFYGDKITPVYAVIFTNEKWYRFSDPDLNVIISQLTTLYKVESLANSDESLANSVGSFTNAN